MPVGVAAPNASICRGVDVRFGPPPRCAGNPANPIFWVPNCPGSREATTPLDATAHNRGPNPSITVLFNRAPARPLSLSGSTKDDIMVGSPGGSDTLRGLVGNNTYVVGDGTATLLAQPGDRVFTDPAIPAAAVVSTALEVDHLVLDVSGIDYVHLTTTGQWSPGTIETPTGDKPVPGSSALTPAQRGAACIRPAPPPGLLPVSTGLAAVDAAAGRKPPAFPGVPVLQGFDVSQTGRDRLFLETSGATFQGRPLHELFRPGDPIPVLLVERVPFAPAKVVSPEERDRLRRKASGLQTVTSEVAPLVYFAQNGLLVLSGNSEPLGGSANPGRVIARLLDRQGKPAVLPRSSDQPLASVTFLTLLPPRDGGDGGSSP